MVLFDGGEVKRKNVNMKNLNVILFFGIIKNIMPCNVPLTPVLEIRLINVSLT